MKQVVNEVTQYRDIRYVSIKGLTNNFFNQIIIVIVTVRRSVKTADENLFLILVGISTQTASSPCNSRSQRRLYKKVSRT